MDTKVNSGSFVSPEQASKYYGVTEQTLRDWSAKGKIQTRKTTGGHRRYFIPVENQTGRFIAYARVSSHKQLEDLTRQITFLKERYPTHEIISDIGSGINYKRPGFKTILGELYARNIREVVVASPDRFSRLGANDLFVWMFEQFGSKLTFISTEESTHDDGLTSDLMEIITVFSARYHGSRKYSKQKNKDLSEQPANSPLPELLPCSSVSL